MYRTFKEKNRKNFIKQIKVNILMKCNSNFLLRNYYLRLTNIFKNPFKKRAFNMILRINLNDVAFYS